MGLGKNTLKFGVRIRDVSQTSASTQGFNGSFLFQSNTPLSCASAISGSRSGSGGEPQLRSKSASSVRHRDAMHSFTGELSRRNSRFQAARLRPALTCWTRVRTFRTTTSGSRISRSAVACVLRHRPAFPTISTSRLVWRLPGESAKPKPARRSLSCAEDGECSTPVFRRRSY